MIRSNAILARLPAIHGAEVGVHRGLNALCLLRKLPTLHLTLIDPWAPPPPQSDYAASRDRTSLGTAEHWQRLYESLCRDLQPFSDRVRVLRMRSPEAATLIQDGSLDFVFLDADHSYPAVAVDIAAWTPKLKPAGWIGGHDYRSHNHAGHPYGVIQAVSEVPNRTLQLGPDSTWFLHPPGENS